MELHDLYADISARTGGNLYIGVVGPVRTGKSTFIKKFMSTYVLPAIEDEHLRARALDELPQSGAGRTVMTAEPKFIPEEGVRIRIAETEVRVRMVDCVGYMVPGALGQFEDELPRMVNTPWFDHEIPMTEAAEIGTRKVITDHATVAVLVTSDGTITEIPRTDYPEAEERVIRELRETGKPFVVLVNSRDPSAEPARNTVAELRQKYGVSATAVDVMQMDETVIAGILTDVLREFPLCSVDVFLPEWCEPLPPEHWLKESILRSALASAASMNRMRDVDALRVALAQTECVEGCVECRLDLANGSARLELDIPDSVFYRIICEQTGLEIRSDAELLPLLTELSRMKAQFERFRLAIDEVEQKGYGIVMPSVEELHLETPELVRQGTQFGVKLSASAPSIHMIRADIKTTVSPVVGSERQSEELVASLLKEFEGDESRIWESNIFGKSLHDLVSEGLNGKLNHMPDAARAKLRETLERIINEGSNGLICIIL